MFHSGDFYSDVGLFGIMLFEARGSSGGNRGDALGIMLACKSEGRELSQQKRRTSISGHF